MIVKAHRDGSSYVADNNSWRLAGPFTATGDAWAWIDEHSGPRDRNDPPDPPKSRVHKRMPRSVTSVTPDQVAKFAPILLAIDDLGESERAFILSMERRATRRISLRLTEHQANWWYAILKRRLQRKQVTQVPGTDLEPARGRDGGAA